MSEIPDAALVLGTQLTGAPRELELAGFGLGIEHAAQIIEVCADGLTVATLADAVPQECFALAASDSASAAAPSWCGQRIARKRR